MENVQGDMPDTIRGLTILESAQNGPIYPDLFFDQTVFYTPHIHMLLIVCIDARIQYMLRPRRLADMGGTRNVRVYVRVYVYEYVCYTCIYT